MRSRTALARQLVQASRVVHDPGNCIAIIRLQITVPPRRTKRVAVRLLIAITLCQLIASASRAADQLPNILWITSEDNGPHLGCYGDTYATTPNLDALAARGLIYTNANSNAPVCAPARTAIISGLYPPSTGSEQMRSLVRLPAGFRMFPQYLRDAGYYVTNNSKEDYNLEKPGRVWDESSTTAHWKNRSRNQPFFAVFNHTISHESQIRNAIARRHRIHDPAQARIPQYHPDTAEVRQDWAQYYDRISMMDAKVGENLKELQDAGLADDTIIFYFSDHGSGMPRSKRFLYNSGLNVPFIVYFPEKWRHLAPPDYRAGGKSDRLISFVDFAPTTLSLAGIKPPAWMQGGAFAGSYPASEPEFSYGFRGRMDERYDMMRGVRDKRYLYIRNYMPHRIYGQHVAYMFQTPTTRVWHELYRQGQLNAAQARFWQTKPAEELYDLGSDPDQVNNLVDSSEHVKVLDRLRSAQRKWAVEIRDVGFLSEWELHQRSEESTPYEMGHDPGRYDFNSIVAAANLATSLKREDLPAIARLLENRDSGVRYWAAVGLLAHGDAGMKLAHDRLVAALEDVSPMVRIAAAEALCRYGNERDSAAAIDVLLKYAGDKQNAFVRLAAWNAIDHLDERAASAQNDIMQIATPQRNSPPRWGNYTTLVKQKTLADLQ
jgi:arylsulfatase A-like enzyme